MSESLFCGAYKEPSLLDPESHNLIARAGKLSREMTS
jgi:hypothetical protein